MAKAEAVVVLLIVAIAAYFLLAQSSGISVGIYGPPDSTQTQNILSALSGEDAIRENIKVIFGPVVYDTTYADVFKDVDVLIVTGPAATSAITRQAFADYLQSGGKMILIGDALTKSSEDPFVKGWDDLPRVPVHCRLEGSECRKFCPFPAQLEVREYEHPILKGLAGGMLFSNVTISATNITSIDQIPQTSKWYEVDDWNYDYYQTQFYELDRKVLCKEDKELGIKFVSEDLPAVNIFDLWSFTFSVNADNGNTCDIDLKTTDFDVSCTSYNYDAFRLAQECTYIMKNRAGCDLSGSSDNMDLTITSEANPELNRPDLSDFYTYLQNNPRYSVDVFLDDVELNSQKGGHVTTASSASDLSPGTELKIKIIPEDTTFFSWYDVFEYDAELFDYDGSLIQTYPISKYDCNGSVCYIDLPDLSPGIYEIKAHLEPGVTAPNWLVIGEANMSSYFVSSGSAGLTDTYERTGRSIAYLLEGEKRHPGIVEGDGFIYFSFDPSSLKDRFIEAIKYLNG